MAACWNLAPAQASNFASACGMHKGQPPRPASNLDSSIWLTGSWAMILQASEEPGASDVQGTGVQDGIQSNSEEKRFMPLNGTDKGCILLRGKSAMRGTEVLEHEE
mmetsp:Transcript_83541/g.194241  ORF Transcript_83541/g.194241 Transcript_83541/m.194241 type:complete len:106 (-) Transcript_83541:332-649(-)